MLDERKLWIAELQAIARDTKRADAARTARIYEIIVACRFPKMPLEHSGRFVADATLIQHADRTHVYAIAALLARVAQSPPVDLKPAIGALAERAAYLLGIMSRPGAR